METPEYHSEEVCRCVGTHTPQPGHPEKHHIWPLGTGGPDTPENIIWVCPTTHTNVHLLEGDWRRAKGEPSWDLRRRYSHFTRELARRAYQSAQAGRLVA